MFTQGSWRLQWIEDTIYRLKKYLSRQQKISWESAHSAFNFIFLSLFHRTYFNLLCLTFHCFIVLIPLPRYNAFVGLWLIVCIHQPNQTSTSKLPPPRWNALVGPPIEGSAPTSSHTHSTNCANILLFSAQSIHFYK